MSIFSLFKKKKELSIDEEYKIMFGDKLDVFAKKEFGIDLKTKNRVSNEDMMTHLKKTTVPDCSNHAYQKYLYGEKLYKKGELDKAIYVLNESIELGNQYPAVYERLIVIYRKQKNYRAELNAIETALDLYAGKTDVITSYKKLSERKKTVRNLMEKDK